MIQTKSECLFEGFLATNNLPFEKIEVDTTPRPDYRVSVGGTEIIFELKELAEDGNFGVVKDPTYPQFNGKDQMLQEGKDTSFGAVKQSDPQLASTGRREEKIR